MLEGKDVRIGCAVESQGVRREAAGQSSRPKLLSGGNLTDQPATLGNAYEFVITGMSPDRESRENSSVEIGVRNLVQGAETTKAEPDILVVEASVKAVHQYGLVRA